MAANNFVAAQPPATHCAATCKHSHLTAPLPLTASVNSAGAAASNQCQPHGSQAAQRRTNQGTKTTAATCHNCPTARLLPSSARFANACRTSTVKAAAYTHKHANVLHTIQQLHPTNPTLHAGFNTTHHHLLSKRPTTKHNPTHPAILHHQLHNCCGCYSSRAPPNNQHLCTSSSQHTNLRQ
jgi:hypothetical protein